jgi:D-arabinose 1-dehydrogenase-like Zn-dependent alcohol dehydrogenase
MATMRAVQIPRAKGPLELVERTVPTPGAGAVRVKVEACGVCHSDAVVKDGGMPGLSYPRVPGHEVIGTIDALGPGVVGWAQGERVGVGWHGGHCGYCEPCRRGQLWACLNAGVTGATTDGGYADYMVARASGLARVPRELASAEAAPLLCAGVTTFNALRNAGARPGDLVAVFGIGGLGHLGVQFAARSGYRTVALARGRDKAQLAAKLGAHEFIDTQAQDPAARLQELGGARVVLATVTSGEAMSSAIGGLGPGGTLLVLGAGGMLQVAPYLLIVGQRLVKGWYSGTAVDSEDTLAFSVLMGVRPLNEVYPLERAPEAYDRMMSGQARFRVVLTTGK